MTDKTTIGLSTTVKPIEYFPSPCGRGLRGGGIHGDHPHPSPLPSRERAVDDEFFLTEEFTGA